ncbi:restriction endonuclease subunit S [Gammaproteobacteria bacterium ESL0073]|nr:restriction endonuclease subunit S [Gammaproteobacteria bacterium ESL0073]
MSEWNSGKLKDIALIEMGQSPSGDTCNQDGIGIPLLNGPTEFGIKHPKAIQYTIDPKKKCQINDILFCVRGSTTGRMNWSDQPYAIGRGIASLRHKKGDDYRFFLKALVDYNLNNMLLSATGSTFPNISKAQLEDLEIIFPINLPEQKAIASVLSSLDNKIDLLHRQNKTLEAMAETLFRQRFVEESSAGWEKDILKNRVFVIDNRGKTPPYLDQLTDYPIIEVNALTNESRLVDYALIRKYVTQETYINWFRGYLQKNDVLVSTVGSIGEIAMVLLEKGNVAQNVVALRAINDLSPFYLYEFLKYKKDEIKELDIGSVQPSIKVPHLLSMEILIPPRILLNQFDSQISNLTDKMILNYSQTQTLEKLRNTLLPKLMSGEVRVTY